jgi:hypothetical protein
MVAFYVIFNKDGKVLDSICSDSPENAISASKKYYEDDFGYVMLIGETADNLYIGAIDD